VTKTVAFTSSSAVSCCCDTSPAVILCLNDPALLAPFDCPDGDEGSTPFELHTIEGTLISCIKNVGACGTIESYRYVVSYDENLLTDPEYALTSDDISGIFCKDCGSQWVEDLVGNEVSFSFDPESGNATFVSQHGCRYTFTAGPIACFTDSATLSLGFDGGGCITGDVILSATADNIIQALGDGLYIPEDVDYDFLPHVDLSYTLGDPTHRWNTVYTAVVNNPGAGNLTLSTLGNISFNAGTTNKLTLSSSGHLSPAANNTYDLGNTTNNFRVAYTRQVAAETGDLVLRGSTGRSIHFYSNNALVLLLDSTTGALYPNVDNTYDLGSTTKLFSTVHTESVKATGVNLALTAGAAVGIDFYSNNIQRWNLVSAGDLVPVINNTYNIGSPSFILNTLFTQVVKAIGLNLSLNSSTGQIDFYSNNTLRAELLSTGMLVPATTITYDLGSSTRVWRRVYADTFITPNTPLSIDAGGQIQFKSSGVVGLAIQSNGQLTTVAANETTGAGSAAFGAGNCPAVTPGAVNTWLKFTKSDASQLYIPAWK
jgi:hypothetical protein